MIDEKYKVAHLLLLIGSNPLPNYVAAKLLLAKGGTPYFVHSTKTQPYAAALRDLFGAGQSSMIDLGTDGETNGKIVYDKVKAKTKEKDLLEGRIGLHYTGGTKVMSIHAYRAVLDAAGQERKPVFSYLDSSRLYLMIERGSNEPLPVDLRLKANYDVVDLTLDKLWKMHGITTNPNKSGHKEPKLINIAAEIAHLYGDGRRDKWTTFINPPKGSPQLNKQSPFSEESLLVPVKTLAQGGYTSVGDLGERVFPDFINPTTHKEDPTGGALRWLRSDWLEDYTLNAVQQTDLFTDAWCSVETLGTSANPQFEVDVVALRGYQLFVFSCTTSVNDGDCKEKLFEAALRARRLGGDEARFALVCPFRREEEGDQKIIITGEKIKNELSELLDRKTFMVFDRSALNNLSTAIRNWAEKLA